MLLCAITDRRRLAPAEGEPGQRRSLVDLVSIWTQAGVNFVQLREKDLDLAALGALAREVRTGADWKKSKLLVNLPPRSDWIRLLAGLADGVHLPGKLDPGSVEAVREIFRALGRDATVSVSCHSLPDIEAACAQGADFALFAPVFEKQASGHSSAADYSPSVLPGQGLDALAAACAAAQTMPIFALGGITAANASACIAAGAAGVAGIRLFVESGWRSLAVSSTDI
jgi:thiamine-phosphate pyrophosphorylase